MKYIITYLECRNAPMLADTVVLVADVEAINFIGAIDKFHQDTNHRHRILGVYSQNCVHYDEALNAAKQEAISG